MFHGTSKAGNCFFKHFCLCFLFITFEKNMAISYNIILLLYAILIMRWQVKKKTLSVNLSQRRMQTEHLFSSVCILPPDIAVVWWARTWRWDRRRLCDQTMEMKEKKNIRFTPSHQWMRISSWALGSSTRDLGTGSTPPLVENHSPHYTTYTRV